MLLEITGFHVLNNNSIQSEELISEQLDISNEYNLIGRTLQYLWGLCWQSRVNPMSQAQ